MRFLLALKCFFLVLFFRRLPEDALALLPPAKPTQPALPPQEAELLGPAKQPARLPEPAKAAKESARPAKEPATLPVTVPVEKPKPDTRGAVQLLAIFQREGRLLDFLQEEIDGYSDAQIGAAVRDIHRGCKKALAEHAPLEPVLAGQENASVRVDAGFDPSRIRLVGNIVGEPPFTGTLRHHGWRTAKVILPEATGSVDPTVVAPAEVELS
jgi:hypothetical protein